MRSAAADADIWRTHQCVCAGNRFEKGSTVKRIFLSERGSVASEISTGILFVGILVIGGLWVIAQLEGVSFQVLLDQLRSNAHHAKSN
jgi:hypothetical protein